MSGDDNDALRRVEERSQWTWAAIRELQAQVERLAQPTVQTYTATSNTLLHGDTASAVDISIAGLIAELGKQMGAEAGLATVAGNTSTPIADAWQLALAALANLRACVERAYEAEAGR